MSVKLQFQQRATRGSMDGSLGASVRRLDLNRGSETRWEEQRIGVSTATRGNKKGWNGSPLKERTGRGLNSFCHRGNDCHGNTLCVVMAAWETWSPRYPLNKAGIISAGLSFHWEEAGLYSLSLHKHTHHSSTLKRQRAERQL